MKKTIRKFLLAAAAVITALTAAACANLEFMSKPNYEGVLFASADNMIIQSGAEYKLYHNKKAVSAGYKTIEYLGGGLYLASNGENADVLSAGGEKLHSGENVRFEHLKTAGGKSFVLAKDLTTQKFTIAGEDSIGQYSRITPLYNNIYIGLRDTDKNGQSVCIADCIRLSENGAEIILAGVAVDSAFSVGSYINIIYLKNPSGERKAVIFAKLTNTETGAETYNLYDDNMNILGEGYDSISLAGGADVSVSTNDYAVRGKKGDVFEVFDYDYVKTVCENVLTDSYIEINLKAYTGAVPDGDKYKLVSLMDGKTLSESYDYVRCISGYDVYKAGLGNTIILLNAFTGQEIARFSSELDYQRANLFHVATNIDNSIALFFAFRHTDENFVKEIRIYSETPEGIKADSFTYGEGEIGKDTLFAYADVVRVKHTDNGYSLIRYSQATQVSDYYETLDIADFEGFLYAKAKKDGKHYMFGLNGGDVGYNNLIPAITGLGEGTVIDNTVVSVFVNNQDGGLSVVPVMQIDLIYRTSDNSRLKQSYAVYAGYKDSGDSVLKAVEIGDTNTNSGIYSLGIGKLGVRKYADMTTDIYSVVDAGITYDFTLDGTDVMLKYETTDLIINDIVFVDYSKPYYIAKGNNSKYGAFNITGDILLPAVFDGIEINSGNAKVTLKSDGFTKYGAVKIQGGGKYKTLHKTTALFLHMFSDGEFVVYDANKSVYNYYGANGVKISGGIESFEFIDSQYDESDLDKENLTAYCVLGYGKDYKVISKNISADNIKTLVSLIAA